MLRETEMKKMHLQEQVNAKINHYQTQLKKLQKILNKVLVNARPENKMNFISRNNSMGVLDWDKFEETLDKKSQFGSSSKKKKVNKNIVKKIRGSNFKF